MTRAGNTRERVAGLLRQPAIWLGLLLMLDLTFVQFDRLFLQGTLSDRFSFENETSYAEQYQHLKELAAAALAAALFAYRRDRLYACWAGILVLLFLDDSFELHERLGDMAASVLPAASAFGVRADHAGELLVSASIGLSVLVLLAFAWRTGTPPARALSLRLIPALLVLGIFGVVIDALHRALADGPWRYRVGIIEDGGELITVTVIVWLLASAVAAVQGARPTLQAEAQSDRSRPPRETVQHCHGEEVPRGEHENRTKAG